MYIYTIMSLFLLGCAVLAFILGNDSIVVGSMKNAAALISLGWRMLAMSALAMAYAVTHRYFRRKLRRHTNPDRQ